MTKNEFLAQLMNELNKNDVADTADIISEYEQHLMDFSFVHFYPSYNVKPKIVDFKPFLK